MPRPGCFLPVDLQDDPRPLRNHFHRESLIGLQVALDDDAGEWPGAWASQAAHHSGIVSGVLVTDLCSIPGRKLTAVAGLAEQVVHGRAAGGEEAVLDTPAAGLVRVAPTRSGSCR